MAVSVYSLRLHAHNMHIRSHPGMYDLQLAQWDCIMARMTYSLCKKIASCPGMHAQNMWTREQGDYFVMTPKAPRAPVALRLNSKSNCDCCPHQTVVTWLVVVHVLILAPRQKIRSSRPQQPNQLPCTSPPLAKTDQALGSLARPQRPRTVLHTAMDRR